MNPPLAHGVCGSWRSLAQRVVWGLCVLLIAVGCARRAPVTPVTPVTPVAPVAPAAPPAVTTPTSVVATAIPAGVTPVGSSSEPTVFVSPRHGYTVTLPCCWVGMPASAAAVEAALAGLRPTPAATDAVDPLPADAIVNALELIAILPDAEANGVPKAQLTVSVLASHELTLDAYLEATAAELTALSNTDVQTTRLDDSLRPDQLPVAVIEYRTGAGRSIAGLQYAFYLPNLEHLVVLTFTTAEELYAELADGFADIARAVTASG